MRKGIDVSKWDVNMDWSGYDWDFAFIKVSEGLVIDRLFDSHWSSARGRTQRGGYHFFRPFVDPKQALGRFLDYLDGDLGELPLVLDLEVTDDIDKRTVVSRALTWLVECKKATGETPIVYTSQGFIDEVDLFDYPDFAPYPLWLAQYPFDKIFPGYDERERALVLHEILTDSRVLHIPACPKPFKKLVYHQWTAKGAPQDVPGYYVGPGGKLAVDFNFQVEEIPPTPQPEPGGTMKGVVKTGFTLKIRDSAGNDTGKVLRAGDTVYGPVINNRIYFFRVYRANGTLEQQAGNSAVRDNTTEWVTLTNEDEPGQEPTPAPEPGAPRVTKAVIHFSDGRTEEVYPR